MLNRTMKNLEAPHISSQVWGSLHKMLELVPGLLREVFCCVSISINKTKLALEHTVFILKRHI
jgi:hypothetical protein